MVRNTEKVENVKHTIYITWDMALKLSNKENETHTLQELEYGEKTEKRAK